MFLLGILIFKMLTSRRRYKSFGVKGLISHQASSDSSGTAVVWLAVHIYRIGLLLFLFNWLTVSIADKL
jgi:hypothetical protein